MTNIRANNDTNIKEVGNLSPLAMKLVYIEQTPNNSQVLKNDNFKQNIKSGDIPSNLVNNKEKIKNTISTAKAVLSVTSSIAKITGQKDDLDNFLNTTNGTLAATEGVIKLSEAKEEKNKTKTIMSSISAVASGVATILGISNRPEVEIISLTGKALDMGVEQQNLSENIEKNNARGITGSVVGLAKGAWGLTLSGAKVVKVGATVGNRLGKVSTATLEKVSMNATKISKFADKIAIPFAVAGSFLSYWDWQIERDKYKAKEVEKLDKKDSNINNNEELKKLENESKSLKINSAVKGVSFALSTISTVALTSSVVAPITAPIAAPIGVATSFASSIVSMFDGQDKRDNLDKVYNKAISYHNKVVDSLDKIIFAPKYAK